MTCKCGCGEIDMDQKFMSKLDLARDIAGTPFVVNSGYRCETYNASDAVKGKPGSAHLEGLAADIKSVGSRKRYRIIKGLVDAGFTRIGIGFNDGFIHVDLDSSKDEEVIWGY